VEDAGRGGEEKKELKVEKEEEKKNRMSICKFGRP